MIDRLLSVNFSELGGVIREVIADPSSNLPVAYLIFGAVTLVVVIVFMAVLLYVMSRDDDEDQQPAVEDEDEPVDRLRPRRIPQRPKAARRVSAAVFWITTLVIVWAVGGYMTSLPYVCTSCHTASPHGAAAKSDPHSGQTCLSCHEPGGYVTNVALGAPARVAHIASGIASSTADPYGMVSRRACLGCHAAAIGKTLTVKALGVRVSHVEPLAAGAECTDCHKLSEGKVGRVLAGMETCIHCHNDDFASAKCTLCHVADVSVAVNGRDRSPTSASVLIPTPDCGGCHVQTKCDNCHGIRMPHTQQFREQTHARAYVENEWFGNGKQCQRCHTATRRPCSKCHDPMPAHGSSLRESHKGADPSGRACTGCHNRPFVATRSFCRDLCHLPGQGRGRR